MRTGQKTGRTVASEWLVCMRMYCMGEMQVNYHKATVSGNGKSDRDGEEKDAIIG